MQADSLLAEPQEKPKNTGVGSLFPSPVDLPDLGIEPGSPELQVDSLPTELSGKPRLDEKALLNYHHYQTVEVSGSRACLRPAAVAAKSLQLCPTLCNRIDGSPPGSSVPRILQARTRSGLPFLSPMHESEK